MSIKRKIISFLNLFYRILIAKKKNHLHNAEESEIL